MIPLTPASVSLSRQDRILIVASIAMITTLAWAYLLHLSRQMSAGMEYEKAMAAMGMPMRMPWGVLDLLATFAMWLVMMIGMMAPAATPVVLLFAQAKVKRAEPGALAASLAFGLGYAAVWSAFSAGATLLQWSLQERAMLSAAMSASSIYVAGAVLITAGAYQLMPWKNKCLKHCQSPLGFLMAHWREGQVGAFQMGFRHGLYCLGCCWALMGILFSVGVMNLVWVAALTVFILIEKTGPQGAVIGRIAGAGLIVFGVALIA